MGSDFAFYLTETNTNLSNKKLNFWCICNFKLHDVMLLMHGCPAVEYFSERDAKAFVELIHCLNDKSLSFIYNIKHRGRKSSKWTIYEKENLRLCLYAWNQVSLEN